MSDETVRLPLLQLQLSLRVLSRVRPASHLECLAALVLVDLCVVNSCELEAAPSHLSLTRPEGCRSRAWLIALPSHHLSRHSCRRLPPSPLAHLQQHRALVAVCAAAHCDGLQHCTAAAAARLPQRLRCRVGRIDFPHLTHHRHHSPTRRSPPHSTSRPSPFHGGATCTPALGPVLIIQRCCLRCPPPRPLSGRQRPRPPLRRCSRCSRRRRLRRHWLR